MLSLNIWCEGNTSKNISDLANVPVIRITFMFQDGISDILDDVTNRFMFGDWRLLHILAFNMSPLVLGEFIIELNNQLREKEELEIPENDSNANLRRPLLTPIWSEYQFRNFVVNLYWLSILPSVQNDLNIFYQIKLLRTNPSFYFNMKLMFGSIKVVIQDRK